jgi:hypothetical protein
MRGIAWAFALCFAAITVLSWKYFFVIPMVFSIVTTLCLIAAAGGSAKPMPNRLLGACRAGVRAGNAEVTGSVLRISALKHRLSVEGDKTRAWLDHEHA